MSVAGLYSTFLVEGRLSVRQSPLHRKCGTVKVQVLFWGSFKEKDFATAWILHSSRFGGELESDSCLLNTSAVAISTAARTIIERDIPIFTTCFLKPSLRLHWTSSSITLVLYRRELMCPSRSCDVVKCANCNCKFLDKGSKPVHPNHTHYRSCISYTLHYKSYSYYINEMSVQQILELIRGIGINH